ncbi:MAG: hypothetical protein JWN70_2370 [Planctomycetaceae bacterium]|nr:hypothetical protein [Planctomycetaceae bacterium]
MTIAMFTLFEAYTRMDDVIFKVARGNGQYGTDAPCSCDRSWLPPQSSHIHFPRPWAQAWLIVHLRDEVTRQFVLLAVIALAMLSAASWLSRRRMECPAIEGARVETVHSHVANPDAGRPTSWLDTPFWQETVAGRLG